MPLQQVRKQHKAILITCFTTLQYLFGVKFYSYCQLCIQAIDMVGRTYRRFALHASTTKSFHSTAHKYNTDSCTLIIDDSCSASTTNNMADFVFPPFKVNASIQGYSGCTTATHIGTVYWKVEDNDGVQHNILLLNTYYSPNGKHRLLCPQHWAQVANDHFPQPNGTWCGTPTMSRYTGNSKSISEQ